jgi:beta-glucosidase-like glycosyl hydrolase
MVEIKINISDLKSEGGDVVKELTDFLKEKTAAEVDAGVDSLTVKTEEKGVDKKYLRVLVRKFLHRKELKDSFRVIAGQQNSLTVKEKKVSEED